VFVKLNSEDAHCVIIIKSAIMNVSAKSAFMNVNAFMNMSQLNAAEIWDMRFNEYLKY